MELRANLLTITYLLQALAKGLGVFYLVLLPVFYSEGLISSAGVGYVGALFVGMLILGAGLVARWLHNLDTRKLLKLAAYISLSAAILLIVGSYTSSLPSILLSYALMGFSVGCAMSGINALAAHSTKRGDRYQTIAQLHIWADIARVSFPLFVAGAVTLGSSELATLLLVPLSFLMFLFASRLSSNIGQIPQQAPVHVAGLRKNRAFRYILSIEFLDSIASAQLFVFLPLLYLSKGYSLEQSLVLQAFIFMGYIMGRWFVSQMARRYSGLGAVGYTKIVMVVCIISLIVVNQLWLLYILTFALGIFARGTSPVLKALAFDTLSESHMRKGSALVVIAGDSGDAVALLSFGLLVAWYGASSPFIAAAIIAAVIALACILRPINTGAPKSAKKNDLEHQIS